VRRRRCGARCARARAPADAPLFPGCLFESLPAGSYRALADNLRLIAHYYSDGVTVLDAFDAAEDFKELSQLGGHGRDALHHFVLVCLLENVVFGEATPALEAARRHRVHYVYLTVMQIMTIARGRPTVAEIAWLKGVIRDFMEELKVAFPNQRSEWGFSKFHGLLHLVQMILEWGERLRGATMGAGRGARGAGRGARGAGGGWGAGRGCERGGRSIAPPRPLPPGSLSNTNMGFFEWYHRFIKKDAAHLNAQVPEAVALQARAAKARVLAIMPQLLGQPVELIDTLGPPGGASASFVLGSPMGVSAAAGATFRAHACSSGRGVADGVALLRFGTLQLKRIHNSVVVSDCVLKEGDVVRLVGAVLSKVMALFSVAGFYTAAGVDYVHAYAAVPVADGTYLDVLDTHVRAVGAVGVVFRTTDVWNKVFAPACLRVSGAAPRDGFEQRAAEVVPNRFVFSSSLERTSN